MKLIETIKKGAIYEYLTLTGKAEYRSNSILYVEATCVCTTTKYFIFSNILRGTSKSCGCKTSEFISQCRTEHGCHRRNQPTHPIYNSYNLMKARCYKESNRAFKNYGGRGILMCDEWLNSFTSFFNWSLSNGWKKGLSIERINNNNGYSPSNCKWATRLEQNRNQRKNVFISAFGESKCISEWATDSRCKIGVNGLEKRIKRGWKPEDAILKSSLKNAA